MGKAGWLTMRNLPVIESDGVGYHDFLNAFFRKRTLCPKCQGKGFRMDVTDYEDTTTVRFQGIKELERLKELEGIKISEVLRDILEQTMLNKKPCKLCGGSRFVARAIAKKWKRKRKARRG